MSKYFPERANVFIDDHIVTPLLAKDYEEADNITKSFNNKYDPEIGSEYTYPTTLTPTLRMMMDLHSKNMMK